MNKHSAADLNQDRELRDDELQHVPTAMNWDSQDMPEVRV